jgi:hypothetical protein
MIKRTGGAAIATAIAWNTTIQDADALEQSLPSSVTWFLVCVGSPTYSETSVFDVNFFHTKTLSLSLYTTKGPKKGDKGDAQIEVHVSTNAGFNEGSIPVNAHLSERVVQTVSLQNNWSRSAPDIEYTPGDQRLMSQTNTPDLTMQVAITRGTIVALSCLRGNAIQITINILDVIKLSTDLTGDVKGRSELSWYFKAMNENSYNGWKSLQHK